MPPSVVQKMLIGVAGAVGVGILTWQTQFPWIKYDLQMLQVGLKVMKELNKTLSTFVIDMFEAQVANIPKKAMVIFEDCVYTYEFMDQQANRVANMMRQLGFKLGDTVAIMINNEPAFIWTLLGAQKLGVAVALINFNLCSKPLSHSIMAAGPSALFVGAGEDLLVAVGGILEDLQGLPVYVQGLPSGQVPTGMQDFDLLMMRALPVQPDRSVREGMTGDTTMAYIYTSGTTGLPKPTIMSQSKAGMMRSFLALIDFNAADVIYTALPLYHTSGYAIGICSVISRGATMVLKRKFSASHFWSDCRRHNVTVVQYLGEIFRYIVAQPEHELDSVHKVRAALGSGLNKDIFEAVQKRFKIPMICEVYGSTEGVSGMVNINKPGATGRISPFLNLIDPEPKVLVKYDHSTALPVRDQNGHCIKIKPGEAGLCLIMAPDRLLTKGELNVYKASKEANEKKLVRNVFKEGDIYFNSGDVLYLDRDYFVYFHDRIGDTFRWKGENVSTTEVASVLSLPDFVLEANVYGVTVPGHDGRAGMVALTLNNSEKITPQQLKQIYKVCEDNLPIYARPLFLRILPEAALTGTFKQYKVELVEQGFDPTKVKDDLYYLDTKAGTYSTLTPQKLASFLQSRL